MEVENKKPWKCPEMVGTQPCPPSRGPRLACPVCGLCCQSCLVFVTLPSCGLFTGLLQVVSALKPLPPSCPS